MAGAYTRGQKRKRECAARLPALALLKVAEKVDEYDRFAFSLTCKAFRDAIREVLNPKKKAGETGATSDEGKEKKALVSNLQTEKLEEIGIRPGPIYGKLKARQKVFMHCQGFRGINFSP